MEDLEKKHLTTRVGSKGNVRVITITDNVPEHWDELISIAKKSYSFWAYIYHDHDKDVNNSDIAVKKHLHLLCVDKGGTTLKRHCERFSHVVPCNFVEKVWSLRAMGRYLVHLDDPDKFQYDPHSVVTNQPDKFFGFLMDKSYDVISEFEDYSRLYRGEISLHDYLDKYRGEFSTMPFFQKQSFFHKLLTSCPNSISSSHGRT